MKLAEEIKLAEQEVIVKQQNEQKEMIEKIKTVLTEDEVRKIAVNQIKIGSFKYLLTFWMEADGTIIIRLVGGDVTLKQKFKNHLRWSSFQAARDTVIGILKEYGFHISMWPDVVGKDGTIRCEISFDCEEGNKQ